MSGGTTIKASCPVCGEVEVAPRDLTLNVSARFPALSHYVFQCPTCQDRVEKPADEHVQNLLHGNGVVPKTAWEPPVYPEHKSRPDAAPLNEDDLIAFGLLLHGAVDLTWWAR
jgi:uncharacterized protein YlaI